MANHILPAASAPSTTLPPAQVAKIWKAAQDFEATALGELLEPMFATVNTADNPFGGGQAETTWRPMLVHEMSRAIANHGGLGLAQPVFAQMLQMQEAAHDTGQKGIGR